MPRDISWTEDLSPDEARAALDALNASKASVTAREATDLIRLQRALQAKMDKKVCAGEEPLGHGAGFNSAAGTPFLPRSPKVPGSAYMSVLLKRAADRFHGRSPSSVSAGISFRGRPIVPYTRS
jgi:hypothetical protein